jgi:hypothetical protein
MQLPHHLPLSSHNSTLHDIFLLNYVVVKKQVQK